MKVSFIIPCRDGGPTLASTLRSVLAETEEGDEILVVDNGSRDESCAIAATFPVQLLSCPRKGAAWARNHGAWKARGEALAFVDADVELLPGWRRAMVAALDGHQAARGTLWPAPPEGRLRTLDRYRWALKHRRTDGSFIEGNVGFPLINTAACMLRTEVFLAMGGFDTALERLEDTDLSLRYRLNNHGTASAPEARALVRFGGTGWCYLGRSFATGRAMARLQQRWGGQLCFEGHPTILSGPLYLFDAINALARGCGQHISTGERLTAHGKG